MQQRLQTQSEDPTCIKWFEETARFLKEQIDTKTMSNYDRFPFELNFEGHTNKISDRTLYDMIQSRKHCKKGTGIFHQLELNQICDKIKKQLLKTCTNLNLPKCKKEIEAARKLYLSKLSTQRAHVLKKNSKKFQNPIREKQF